MKSSVNITASRLTEKAASLERGFAVVSAQLPSDQQIN
jgi:hypothetical protein